MTAPICDTCQRPKVACVCDRIVSYPTERRVLILQHPQEQDAVLGSAQILAASLPQAKIVVGLSWPNFAKALGEEGADPRRWLREATLQARLRVPATLAPGKYSLWLWLPDAAPSLQERPDYAIRFANEPVWDDANGENKLGDLELAASAPGAADTTAAAFVVLPN